VKKERIIKKEPTKGHEILGSMLAVILNRRDNDIITPKLFPMSETAKALPRDCF